MLYLLYLLAAVIVYHYMVFPLVLLLAAKLFPRPHHKAPLDKASVSFIVAALNEEKVLREKIANCFDLDYPPEKIEFIFVLDGSTDRSPEMVRSYENPALICLHEPKRSGKTAALNRAVEYARGEVLVFSDANSMFERHAIRNLLQNLADPSIGGVCGRKGIVENLERAASRGDSFFWDVESTIKILESRLGSISTGDGEIFAVRRNLFRRISDNIINDDTAITFELLQQGYRVVYEPSAVTYEEASITLRDDFNVKVRMVAGGYQTLQVYWGLLFCRMPLFGLQFLSHKVLRWFMPVLLIGLLACNLFLLEYQHLRYFLILQSVFYLGALLGHLTGARVLYLPLYYVIMNVAALKGLFRFLRGDLGITIWKKAQR